MRRGTRRRGLQSRRKPEPALLHRRKRAIGQALKQLAPAREGGGVAAVGLLNVVGGGRDKAAIRAAEKVFWLLVLRCGCLLILRLLGGLLGHKSVDHLRSDASRPS